MNLCNYKHQYEYNKLIFDYLLMMYCSWMRMNKMSFQNYLNPSKFKTKFNKVASAMLVHKKLLKE